jgi:flagellar biosynthetic protein FlhB
LAFAAGGAALAFGVTHWQQAWRGLLAHCLRMDNPPSPASIVGAMNYVAFTTGLWCAPVAAAALCAAVAGSLAQGGFVLAPGALRPKLERISPASRLKNLVSITALVQMAKSLVVAAVLAWVAWTTVSDRAALLLNSPFLSGASIAHALASLAFALAWKTALVLCLWSGADYFVTRWKHERDLRMSRDDLKQEIKETEGNPQMKARIRRLQRQQRRRRMLQDVKRATVVVTNPSHYAVALEYTTEMAAPVVLAKGRDLLAQQIKQIANWNGIPVMENVPLAHALYRTAEVGQTIPARLYAAVAEILAFVYRAQSHAGRGGRA